MTSSADPPTGSVSLGEQGALPSMAGSSLRPMGRSRPLTRVPSPVDCSRQWARAAGPAEVDALVGFGQGTPA